MFGFGFNGPSEAVQTRGDLARRSLGAEKSQQAADVSFQMSQEDAQY